MTASRPTANGFAVPSEIRSLARPPTRRWPRTRSTITGSRCAATASTGTSAIITWPTRSIAWPGTTGLGSKGLIWKHSTHTGAHGLTDMAREGSTRSADSSGSDTAAMASR